MANCSARDQVIVIPELLERILLQLPLRKILVVQRVCKLWLSVVTESYELQTALFLKPLRGHDSISETSTTSWIFGSTVEQDGMPHPFRLDMPPVRVNPMIFEKLPLHWNPLWDLRVGESNADRKDYFMADVFNEFIQSDPKASWRKMLLTQPPYACASIWICFPIEIPLQILLSNRVGLVQDGFLKMGSIQELLEEQAKYAEESFPGIVVNPDTSKPQEVLYEKDQAIHKPLWFIWDWDKWEGMERFHGPKDPKNPNLHRLIPQRTYTDDEIPESFWSLGAWRFTPV
ncbi:MAG: hypothetical protein M1820_001528 [Bogoriella megaspora]|nr:MAG: hypothetical protein M1820_001528 [Bogoriella megaspora]